jgi:hypothetical protein
MSDSFTERMDHYNASVCPLRNKHCSCCENTMFGQGKVCIYRHDDGRDVITSDRQLGPSMNKVTKCPIPDEKFKEYGFNDVPSVVS